MTVNSCDGFAAIVNVAGELLEVYPMQRSREHLIQRSRVARVELIDEITLSVLLNGLGQHEMATATNVVRVIRQRLERDARALARRENT